MGFLIFELSYFAITFDQFCTNSLFSNVQVYTEVAEPFNLKDKFDFAYGCDSDSTCIMKYKYMRMGSKIMPQAVIHCYYYCEYKIQFLHVFPIVMAFNPCINYTWSPITCSKFTFAQTLLIDGLAKWLGKVSKMQTKSGLTLILALYQAVVQRTFMLTYVFF